MIQLHRGVRHPGVGLPHRPRLELEAVRVFPHGDGQRGQAPALRHLPDVLRAPQRPGRDVEAVGGGGLRQPLLDVPVSQRGGRADQEVSNLEKLWPVLPDESMMKLWLLRLALDTW